MLKNNSNTDKYVSILSDGTIRLVVPEGTENAVKREYETSDGKAGVKYELVYTELTGLITKVDFWEGDYGKLIQLTVDDPVNEGEDPVILSVSTASNFGEDIMKKLPAVDTSKLITIAPYSFDDDKGKKRKGVTLTQDGVKIENYYYDKDKKKNINGYPEIKITKKMSKDDWKMYFLKARMFMIDELSKKFGIEDKVSKADKDFAEFNKDDVPFD